MKDEAQEELEVVITGIGVALPGCRDRATLWRHLKHGESQLSLEPSPLGEGVLPLGLVKELAPEELFTVVPEKHFRAYPRDMQQYLASVLRARRDAGVDLQRVPAERVALFDGSSRGAFAHWYEHIRREPAGAAEHYGVRQLMFGTPGQPASVAAALLRVEGPVATFSNSCCSGAVAIGQAYRELRQGEVDVAFATGHDAVLTAPLLQMYLRAGLLSAERDDARRAIRPFGGSRNAFGEGAVTLVMERRDHAERRGATVLASLAGYRYGNTGRHPTDIDATGERPTRLLSRLLSDAAVSSGEIRVVVGHGNGVPTSDESERLYMRNLFGERAAQVPLVSVKPIYGHLLGASSALNAAAAALMVHHRYVVPTANVPADSAFNHQGTVGKEDPCDAVLSISYGLGGHNTALLLRRPSTLSSNPT